MRRKRERGPQLPPEAGATGPVGDSTTGSAEDPSAAPGEEEQKRGGVLAAIKESMRQAALRHTSTKR